jgi:hypothetical protein
MHSISRQKASERLEKINQSIIASHCLTCEALWLTPVPHRSKDREFFQSQISNLLKTFQSFGVLSNPAASAPVLEHLL